MSIDFASVLGRMVEVRASDVHISPGYAPAMRVNGEVTPLEGFETLTPQDSREIASFGSRGGGQAVERIAPLFPKLG